MKRLEIAGFLLILIGFILKLFRFPFHTWIIVAAILLLIAIYSFLKIKKQIELDSLFIGMSSTFFFVWLLFLTKFFPMAFIPLVLAIIFLILGIYFKFQNKNTLADGRQWLNLIVIILCFVVYRLPLEERYYIVGIRFNNEIESDYQTWAKYSWFLYRAGKYDESFSASEKALSIANQMRDEYWVDKIIDQQEKIKDRDWLKY